MAGKETALQQLEEISDSLDGIKAAFSSEDLGRLMAVLVNNYPVLQRELGNMSNALANIAEFLKENAKGDRR